MSAKIFGILCTGAVLFFGTSSRATIIENFDSLPTTSAPTVSGQSYSLGDGWSAIASDLTQHVYYAVATAQSFEDSSNTSPNNVTNIEGAGSRDTNTEQLMVVSPLFKWDGTSNSITAYLEGGSNGTTPPTSITGIGGAGTVATGTGWQGLVLADSNGNVIESVQRGSSNNSWLSVSMPTTGLNTSTTYQLALVDTYSGGWGWVSLDTVSIPGTLVPEPASLGLLGLCAIGLLARVKPKARPF